jgi:long-chain acyl-CoA synthetase
VGVKLTEDSPVKETLVDIFWQRVRTMPEQSAIMHKVDGSYQNVIWREHGRIVELLAGGLLKAGVGKGDKVAIMSQTRVEWTWADLSILSSQAASVPIYPTLAPQEVHYLLKNSGCKAIFVENQTQLNKILSCSEIPDNLHLAILINGEVEKQDIRLRCIAWQDLLKDGEVYLLTNPEELTHRIQSIDPGDLASIVYTSGTTGIPKGAMLLHSTIYAVCKAVRAVVEVSHDDVMLSFLPLSHVYERVGGQFFGIFSGMVIAYADSIEKVPQNMVEVHPTIINGVPRFYEKAYQRIQTEIRHLPQPQQYLIRWALSLSKRAAQYQESKQPEKQLAKQIYRAELRIADRLVFSRIRRRFGGKLRIMVSGAAPLSFEVHSFFEAIGLHIFEGYGLTETAAPAASNVPNDNKPGTVGKPLPGVQIRIADDGEIMIKGKTVFAGYYKNEEATRAAFVDGWFLTGDIGELDDGGYLKIKDRKKDIIITAGGKHVAPQYIENLFKGDSLVSQILVYGDRRKFITALITLNKDAVLALAKTNGINTAIYSDLIENKTVIDAVSAIVISKNELLANFEQIKKFKILENEFSVEADEITPTFKIKRKVVTERFKKVLDSFYDSEDLELEGEKPQQTKQER